MATALDGMRHDVIKKEATHILLEPHDTRKSHQNPGSNVCGVKNMDIATHEMYPQGLGGKKRIRGIIAHPRTYKEGRRTAARSVVSRQDWSSSFSPWFSSPQTSSNR